MRLTYAIVIEPSHPLQREQVQEIVKANAETWWHGIADLWFVTGKSAKEWRDSVGVVFPIGSGKVIVVKVDVDSAGTWAFRGAFSPSEKTWLRENL
jgi:hypothetical protein